MPTEEELTKKANRCRRLAAAIDDPRARVALIELAERYEADLEGEAPPETSSES